MGDLLPINMIVTKPIDPYEQIPVVYNGEIRLVSGRWWVRHERDRWIKRGHKASVVEVLNEGRIYEQLEQYGPRD